MFKLCNINSFVTSFHLIFIEEDVPRLEVFFTHAYAAWEKGTNERHNGLLREFIANVNH